MDAALNRLLPSGVLPSISPLSCVTWNHLNHEYLAAFPRFRNSGSVDPHFFFGAIRPTFLDRPANCISPHSLLRNRLFNDTMDISEECNDMELSVSLPAERKNLLALLHLPIGSVVTMDGSAIVLQRSDFVGVHSIPEQGFHTLMVRGGSLDLSERRSGDTAHRRSNPSATTVGFAFLEVGSHNRIFVRQFDRHTEEVSSSPVDTKTETNLRQQFEYDRIDPRGLLRYNQVVSPSQQDVWVRSTGFISRTLLDLRGIQNGEKLVPGAYCSIDDSTAVVDESLTKCVDGRAITYPPIPIFPLKAKSHAGTRQFLQSLQPTMRTMVYFDSRTTNSTSTVVFEYLLNKEYRQQWECILGDVQLAFVLFLNLQCYSSWIHWRDLVSMLSSVDRTCMQRHMQFFSLLFTVLSLQIELVEEKDILDGVDITEEDGFLIPSFRSLLDTSFSVPELRRNEPLLSFRKVLFDKFPEHFSTASMHKNDFHGYSNINIPETFVGDEEIGFVSKPTPAAVQGGCGSIVDDDDDSEGPVVVVAEEFEESITRSQQLFANNLPIASPGIGCSRDWLQERYPLLLAAMDGSSYKEDILMTCARVLYDASDVSLVREAAAYLEEIEAKNIQL